MTPWHTNLSGNLIWAIVVTTLASVVVIPVYRDQLSPEALNNLAIGALATLSAVAIAAANFVWRGKLEKPDEGTRSTGDGTTTVIPPAGTSSRTTVETTADPGKPSTLPTPRPPS